MSVSPMMLSALAVSQTASQGRRALAVKTIDQHLGVAKEGHFQEKKVRGRTFHFCNNHVSVFIRSYL